MAVTTSRVTVGTGATMLFSPTLTTGVSALIRNLSAGTVYVGGADTDTNKGLPLKQNEVVSFGPIAKGQDLYGVVAAATSDVIVLVL